MNDFLKNNKSIALGLLVLIVIIIALVGVVLFGGGTPNEPADEENPFANVDENRPMPTSTQGFFANPGERFVPEDQDGEKAPLLRAISSMPVVGATAFERLEDGKMVPYVRYTNYTNGHIYETTLATLGSEEKVANNTLTRIGKVFWAPDGATTLAQYYDEDLIVVRTHLGELIFETSTTSNESNIRYEGRDMSGNIIDVAFSPNGTEFFYLVKTLDGTIGYLESIETGERTVLYTTKLQSISVSWDSEGEILVYTKPTAVAESIVWKLNPETGAETVLLTGESAVIPLMNPEGSKMLYSTQERNNKLFNLKVLDVTTQNITPLPVATMASKCAWGPFGSKYIYCAVPTDKVGGVFLEEWFKGLVESEDNIWRIDTEAGVVKKLVDPHEETEQTFDVVDMEISPAEDFAVFRTRNNAVLWGLTLPENTQKESDELAL